MTLEDRLLKAKQLLRTQSPCCEEAQATWREQVQACWLPAPGDVPAPRHMREEAFGRTPATTQPPFDCDPMRPQAGTTKPSPVTPRTMTDNNNN